METMAESEVMMRESEATMEASRRTNRNQSNIAKNLQRLQAPSPE